MDDSTSDDINVVSTDDDLEISNVEVEIELEDDEDDDDVQVVNVSFEGDAAAVAGGGHESPGNDEVVVVDENVVTLVEDSDDQEPETSEDEDARGQEEEGDGEENPESDQPASPSVLSTSSSPPRSATPENQDPLTVVPPQPTSSHTEQELASPPRRNDNPTPDMPVSQNTPVPGPSVPHNPNSSMDDFQTPAVHHWPVLSAALAATSSNESIVEFFRSPKRRRIVSPEKGGKQRAGSSVNKKSAGDDGDCEDDGNHCSICFEPWDNSGRHRLASLKCGHLFGLGCIEKWLKGQGGKCPSCNDKAKMKDIRVIYAKAVKMADTTERDRALLELEKEKDLRRRVELEAAQVRLQCRQYIEESGRLRDEVTKLRTQLSTRTSTGGGGGVTSSQSNLSQLSQSHQSVLRGQFTHCKTVRIFEGGQCRVVTHCPFMALLVISQPSTNSLFPGFGIKKLSCMDFKTASYLTLHQKPIRGLSFHQTVDNGLLLSAAMDRTVKLTSVLSNSVVQTYTVPLPVWSCEWNADNQNYFFVGQQNGVVLEFDTRNTTSHLRELNAEGSKSPVIALQYMSRDPHAAFKPGGIIVGQLDRVSFFESKGDNDNRLHILPLEGNLTSLNVDVRTRHLLASFRPSAKYPSVRHQLCELTSVMGAESTEVSCNVVETFHGGRSQSVLGRTRLMTHPADDSRLLVVAGDEHTESTHIWDAGSSQLVQRLPCQGVPLDFSPFPYNHTPYLAALTDKCLKLHHWN
ncbi:hypothetical protein ACOMHN_037518 [Nucella lapillus]